MKYNYTLFFSSTKEANALIYQSKIKFEKDDFIYHGKTTNDENIQIIITGIGGKNTLNKLEKVNFDKENIFIKFGTCAVPDYNLEILKPFIPQNIFYSEKKYLLNFEKIKIMIKNLLSKEIQLINKNLLTVDKPLINISESKNILSNGYSFVDMETFFIADKFKNELFLPVIVGTDRGDEFSKIDFFKNLPIASSIFKDLFDNFIQHEY
jgi:hypothetical protein